ncbi:hypothetical protein MBT84_19980 [Streptomyces sp. MBT84]|uniref:hypothetical protein n=1 Tax=Streptomyces sp. MBT84 TaxID=1488414 RepID=UPI001C6E667A|nr:hypothetical protein [Streptomyces sp. MBT84]MBW8701890.1 hypothetical protein [Streptomyces sp. MBT84]
MAFPQTPLDVRIDLQINGIWTDITPDVYAAEKISITRGRADEGARVDPGRCSLTLNNRLGKYSPRNPMSPYYQLIGRNTPIRVSVPGPVSYLELDGHAANNASTPDAAALDITGDLDMRWEGEADWNAAGAQILIGKWGAAGNRSYHMRLQDGFLYLHATQDGTLGLAGNWRLPALPRHAAVRATLDVNNGIAGSDWTFYWAPTIDGPWTQFGFVRTTSGPISIFPTSAPLSIAPEQLDASPARTAVKGRVYKAEVRSGINGTVVANPSFTAQAPGTTSFTDGAGRTWSLTGTAVISNRANRFVGEVSSWPSRWDVSGKDIRVPIEAAGILRRLGQGAKALDSTLRRSIPPAGPLAYWPMEEGQNATQAYSPISNVSPLAFSRVTWAGVDTLASSKPLPALASNGGAAAVMLGRIPAPAATLPSWSVRWVYRLDTPNTTGRTYMRILSTGTVAEWYVQTWNGGTTFFGRDADGGTVFTQNINTGSELFGQWIYVRVIATQNGGNVDWEIDWFAVGGVAEGFTGSFAGTVGRPTAVTSPPGGFSADLDGMAIGHISAWPTGTTSVPSYDRAVDAWAGETAGARMLRLSTEEALPLAQQGDPTTQEQVGPQTPDTLVALLEEAADTDGGVLYEQRDSIGLVYRDRHTLYNQTPALLLDYNTPGHVAPPLEPVDDDQKVRNNITVTRSGGSSAQAVLEDGSLSVQDPPNGVGVYDDSVTLNLYSDDQTDQQAGWRLHLGTVDEARYPSVNIDLAAAPSLINQILTLDSGDRVQIANPPAWLPPGPIDLIVQGYTEVIGHPNDWDLQLNCTPASPWTVGVAGDPVLGKADTEGTKLTSALTSTDTVALVTTTSGPVWTSSLAQTPIDWKVGGEVVRVLAPGPMTNANALFDAGVGSWSGTNATIAPDTTLPRPHPSALGLVKVTPSGGTFSVLAGTTLGPGTAGPNGRYQLSAWVYSPNGWASGLQLQANWFNSSGTYLTTTGGTITAIPAGTWTPLLDVVISPAGADRAQVLVRQNGTPAASDVYYAWAVQISRISASTIYDEFGRSVTGSWGAADSLQTWTLTGGTGTDFSVTSGYGRHINTAVSAAHHSTIAAPSPDFDIYCDIAVAALSTGASQFAGILGRFVDLNNLYEARTETTTGGAVILSIRKRVASVETQLGTFTSALTAAAGTFVRVRFQGTGTSLRARIWAVNGEEPTAWHVDVTDSAFSAAGSIGVKSVRNAGNTNTNAESRFENFALINPQQFTVARSLNGIVKAQSSGTDVRLAQPAVAAL